MVTVVLPRSLAAIVPELSRRAEVEASNVAEVVAALDARWPGVADRLLESPHAVRPHVNVFVDGEPASITTPTPASSTVHFIPAVAGG
jgi:molybdopterin converting factor small subunit